MNRMHRTVNRMRAPGDCTSRGPHPVHRPVHPVAVHPVKAVVLAVAVAVAPDLTHYAGATTVAAWRPAVQTFRALHSTSYSVPPLRAMMLPLPAARRRSLRTASIAAATALAAASCADATSSEPDGPAARGVVVSCTASIGGGIGGCAGVGGTAASPRRSAG